jgi:hypothetical protein
MPGHRALRDLSERFVLYAEQVYGSYSPLNAALSLAVANDQRLLGMLCEGPLRGRDPNLFLAALQYLVMGGTDHPLGELYRGARANSALGSTLYDFCKSHLSELFELLGSRWVQTNEVGRAPALAAAVAEASVTLGGRVALVDAGAAAGLNLCLDRFRLVYRRNGLEEVVGAGPKGALRIGCRVGGGGFEVRPLPHIALRVGLDRSPLDLGNPLDRRWLLACTWPGSGRQGRLRAAMDQVGADQPQVRRRELLQGLREVLEELEPLPTVVVTAWSVSYLSPQARNQLVELLARFARRRPLAWVYADSVGCPPVFVPPCAHQVPTWPKAPKPGWLGLGLWRAGRLEGRLLASMHPHGDWMRWRGWLSDLERHQPRPGSPSTLRRFFSSQ